MADGRGEAVAEMATMELVITRAFNASREQVWKAWTDPQSAMRWWGPKDFTAPVCKIDLRVGGKYHFCMRGAGLDGVVRDFWTTGAYKEIVPYKKLVMTDCFADEKGNAVPATHYGMSEDFPLEMLIEVTLDEAGGKTKMTLRHKGLSAGMMSDLTNDGWNQSFDKLDSVFEATRGVL